MLKKALWGFAAVTALGLVSFGRDFLSYLTVAGSEARQALRSNVPVEFEIRRARDLVANLGPEIRKCLEVIAEEEVALEQLNREIAGCEAGLGQQKQEILLLRGQVEQNQPSYRFAGRTYTTADLKSDLNQRFARFKTAESTLASRQSVRNQREQALVAVRQKLDSMLNERRTLEVEIEHLESRHRQIQTASSTSRVQLDDSQLSRARSLVANLNRQLDVQSRLLDSEGKFTGLIPVTSPAAVPEDLAQQIDSYFAQPATTVAAEGVLAERESR